MPTTGISPSVRFRALPMRIRGLIRNVGRARGVDPLMIIGGSHRKGIVAARDVVAATLRRDGFSLPEIGRMLDRTHGAIHHSLRKGAAPHGG